MKFLILVFGLLMTSCSFIDFDHKGDFEFQIDSVLTADGKRSLYKDDNGYYHLFLERSNKQTLSRVTGHIYNNGLPPEPREKVIWKSNLFWVLKEGSILVTVVKSYLNVYTGQWTVAQLPSFVAREDYIVPTTNCCSYSSENGIVNTMIAPVVEMVGDTLVLQANNSTSNKSDLVKIVLE
jgi:hypothetical protein